MTQNKNRQSGLIILALVALAGLIFGGGLARRSYWALAAPVAAGTLGGLYVAFWIARALIMTPPAEGA